MANFDDQVMGLTGLTINGSSTAPSQSELTQFLTDGAKEIINQLPIELKEKCMAITALTSSSGQDLDGFGEVVFVSRETGDTTSIYAPCRKIPSMYGGMAADSSSLMYYGTATDPVYWVDGTGDAATLFVKPNPDSDQDAKIFHISYPSVAYNGNGTITSFPDEAEYLVVLYAAIKSLQSAMGEMNASIVHSDQDGSWTTANTSGQNQGWGQVKHWIENEEDNELAQVQVAALSAELQQFVTEYQWYQGQQAKLQQDYDKGLAALKGGQ
tara:strand:+ start:1002 stop:1808 length:807 start_codon:yes stop_codon:yes gene_type:complete